MSLKVNKIIKNAAKNIFMSVNHFVNPYKALFGLKSLKKMSVISLYWFAAQRQTSNLDSKNMAVLHKI